MSAWCSGKGSNNGLKSFFLIKSLTDNDRRKYEATACLNSEFDQGNLPLSLINLMKAHLWELKLLSLVDVKSKGIGLVDGQLRSCRYAAYQLWSHHICILFPKVFLIRSVTHKNTEQLKKDTKTKLETRKQQTSWTLCLIKIIYSYYPINLMEDCLRDLILLLTAWVRVSRTSHQA